MDINDNEHDPEQDPEYVTPAERRQWRRWAFIMGLATGAWITFLIWLGSKAL